jgi:acetyl-CoA carboxylase biotin carboxyl carrier protein
MNGKFTFEQIQELIRVVANYQIGGFSYECGDMKLRIDGVPVSSAPGRAPALRETSPAQEGQTASGPGQPDTPGMPKLILSPLVGTFYMASGSDREPYVRTGQPVKKGDIVFVVESMKVMNEVPSDMDGVVAQFLVENGQTVEFGQPVLRLE